MSADASLPAKPAAKARATAGKPGARFGIGARKGLRRLELDFHSRRYSALGLVLLAAGTALSLAVLTDYSQAKDEARRWQGKLTQLQQPQGKRAARSAGGENADKDREQAMGAVDQAIARPWAALFASIEAAQNEDIALLTLSPDTAGNTVRLSGEARKREAILSYVERLEQGQALLNVVLLEDQLQRQDPDRPFRFTLSADWATAP